MLVIYGSCWYCLLLEFYPARYWDIILKSCRRLAGRTTILTYESQWYHRKWSTNFSMNRRWGLSLAACNCVHRYVSCQFYALDLAVVYCRKSIDGSKCWEMPKTTTPWLPTPSRTSKPETIRIQRRKKPIMHRAKERMKDKIKRNSPASRFPPPRP